MSNIQIENKFNKCINLCFIYKHCKHNKLRNNELNNRINFVVNYAKHEQIINHIRIDNEIIVIFMKIDRLTFKIINISIFLM